MSLRRALRSELRKRGLWNRPPSYLGIYGLAHWADADWTSSKLALGRDEAWELVIECFRYVFLDRYRYLARQLEIRPNIEGLIFRNIRNFLHDTQKKHDPLGFRVFVILQGAVLEALAEGELYVLAGDPQIRNPTALGFEEGTNPEVMADGLEDIVRGWNDLLLPDLITARGQAQARVVATLRSLLGKLSTQGIQAFRFGQLIEPLKNDVRRRWSALFDFSEGAIAVEEADEDFLRIVRRIGPDTSFEARHAFQGLVDCVVQTMDHLEDTPASQRYLSKLWNFLRIYAADPEDHSTSEAPLPAQPDSKLPSRRRLARELGIPRNRMGRLYSILGELTAGCRRALSTPPTRLPLTAEGQTMTDRTRSLELLRQGAGQARQRSEQQVVFARQTRRPLAPGDLVLMARTAEAGLEWAILEEDRRHSRRFLVVPADPNPLQGSTDVAVPATAPGGPLSLRCGFRLWIAAAELEPKLRTAILEPAQLEAARHKRRKLEARTLAGTELEQEVDLDPEYRYWRREILEPARSAFAEEGGEPAPGRVVAFPTPGRWGSMDSVYGIAASVLLVVSLGLSAGLLWQHRRIGDLKARVSGGSSFEAMFNQPLVAFHASDATRAETRTITVPPGPYLLRLLIAVKKPEALYRLKISRQGSDEEPWDHRWASDELGELSATLPSSQLPPGVYRLQLFVEVESREEWVGEYGLSIVTAKKAQ